jgi:hypothetical protein
MASPDGSNTDSVDWSEEYNRRAAQNRRAANAVMIMANSGDANAQEMRKRGFVERSNELADELIKQAEALKK